jgi:hypothetical protein
VISERGKQAVGAFLKPFAECIRGALPHLKVQVIVPKRAFLELN